ncbi:MAG TPA: hypothetical protein DCQ79_04220, partial [Rhizobiales bacterium]|nr:hypothetical protein [Hyphomicrobiales bacterium]
LWTGQKARTAALAIGALLSAGFFVVAAKTSELAGAAGRLLSAASSSLGAKTTALAGASGRALSAGLSQVSAKIHTLTPQIGRFLAICFSGIAARVGDLSRSTGRLLAIGFAALAVKADAFARSTGRLLAPHFAWICAKAYALAPSLAERVAKAGLITAHFARKGAGRVQTLLATATAARFRTPRAETQLTEVSLAEAPLAEGKNEVSSPTRIGGFALSQMLIIAGALFLVCGGLMLGGGLILRAGTPAPVATSDGIVWFFEQKGLPIAERSVFAFAGMSEGVRVTGFSISGENQSDQPMTSVAGLIKPDGDRPELTLAVSVDMPGGEASVVHPPEVHVAEPLAGGVIPPHARFKLAFPFPVEAANGEHGVTAEEVLATFGGLMLTVHYDYEGKQKAFMLYLSPSMLKDQLAEIQAEPNG